MSRPASNVWIVLAAPDSWQILCRRDQPSPLAGGTFAPEQFDEQAEPIVDALQQAGWRRSPLVLAITPQLCLSATVDVPSAALLRKPQAMRYHLEGWIPWSAEEFVCDYVAHQRAALMVAARVDRFRQLLGRLDELDAPPIALVPAPLLALERHLMESGLPKDHALLWRHDGQTELFIVAGGKPLHWRRAEGDSTAEVLQLCAAAALELGATVPWLARGMPPNELHHLTIAGIAVESLEEIDWSTALLDAATDLAEGRSEPLVNLRRDELAGARPVVAVASQLRRLKFAAALLVISIAGGLWHRGEQYAQSALALDRRLIEVYERAFPDKPPPERILPAMRQAHQLLQGTRGPVKQLAAAPSSDVVLEKLLVALPSDLRYRVPEIRIENGSVYLAGEVRSNSDADRIAGALRSGGFTVESPRTQRLAEQGFSVRVAGQWGDVAPGDQRK